MRAAASADTCAAQKFDPNPGDTFANGSRTYRTTIFPPTKRIGTRKSACAKFPEAETSGAIDLLRKKSASHNFESS